MPRRTVALARGAGTTTMLATTASVASRRAACRGKASALTNADHGCVSVVDLDRQRVERRRADAIARSVARDASVLVPGPFETSVSPHSLTLDQHSGRGPPLRPEKSPRAVEREEGARRHEQVSRVEAVFAERTIGEERGARRPD